MKKLFGFIRKNYHPVWQLRRLKFYKYFSKYFDIPIAVSLHGYKVYVYLLRDISIWLRVEDLEPEVSNIFDLLVFNLKPVVFWDIGANIGYYSWRIAAKNENIELVLFEPDPINFQLLNKTVTRNKLYNVNLLECAVSNKVGIDSFVIDEVSGSTGQFERLYNTSEECTIAKSYGHSKRIEVKTVALDYLLESGYKPPQLIKVDVEEAENLVIEGAFNLLKNYEPTILLEAFSGKAVLEKISSFGYKIYSVDNNANFLCIPESKLDTFNPESYGLRLMHI